MKHIHCRDCGAKVGETIEGHEPRPDAHGCVSCWMKHLGHKHTEWLHLNNQPRDVHHMMPLTTLHVVKRGLFQDVMPEANDDIAVSLCHEDLRDAPTPLLMGNLKRKLTNGWTHIDGLYVRGTGNFCLKLEAPGHEPVYTHSFKVT